jgi:hypothetical protein
MTLKTIVNDVCDIIEIDQFESVYGNSDPGALTMLELAQQAGDEIARRGDWKVLLSTSVIMQSGAQLPADFQRLVPGGVRKSNNDFIRPVTNSAQWAVVSSVPALTAYYFLSGSVIFVSPVSAGFDAVLDYVSKYWVISAGNRRATFTSDDDTASFPERLLVKNMVWRWLRSKGLAYQDHLAEFEADLQQELNADRGDMR